MTDSVTVSTGSFVADGFRRGDYITHSGMPQYTQTASGWVRVADLAPQRQRILTLSTFVITTRPVERLPVLEWMLARTEDWIVWPCADMAKRLRAAVHQ
jgi:hypothetical protein